MVTLNLESRSNLKGKGIIMRATMGSSEDAVSVLEPHCPSHQTDESESQRVFRERKELSNRKLERRRVLSREANRRSYRTRTSANSSAGSPNASRPDRDIVPCSGNQWEKFTLLD